MVCGCHVIAKPAWSNHNHLRHRRLVATGATSGAFAEAIMAGNARGKEGKRCHLWCAVLACVALLLGACATPPALTGIGARAPESPGELPPVGAVIRHIECEIAEAMNKVDDDDVKKFLKYDWVVYATLTIDEQQNEGLTPNLSFIHPLSAASTNFTAVANGEVTGQQHRNFSQSFALDLDPGSVANTLQSGCKGNAEDKSGISGDLGIRQIIVEGARHRDAGDYQFPIVGDESNLTQQQKDAIGSITGELRPTFASTIDFTLVYGITGLGPTWSITHFAGPGNSGMLNWTRQSKDTLVLSFASWQKHVRLLGPADEAQQTQRQVSKAMAAAAAQAQATRLILQQLHVSP